MKKTEPRRAPDLHRVVFIVEPAAGIGESNLEALAVRYADFIAATTSCENLRNIRFMTSETGEALALLLKIRDELKCETKVDAHRSLCTDNFSQDFEAAAEVVVKSAEAIQAKVLIVYANGVNFVPSRFFLAVAKKVCSEEVFKKLHRRLLSDDRPISVGDAFEIRVRRPDNCGHRPLTTMRYARPPRRARQVQGSLVSSEA